MPTAEAIGNTPSRDAAMAAGLSTTVMDWAQIV